MITYNTKSIRLKVDAECSSELTKEKAITLALLNGWYNWYWRNIPLEEYDKVIKMYEKTYYEMLNLYRKYANKKDSH